MKETLNVNVQMDNGLIITDVQAKVTFDLEDASFDHEFGVHKQWEADYRHPVIEIIRCVRSGPWGIAVHFPSGELLKEIEKEVKKAAIEKLESL